MQKTADSQQRVLAGTPGVSRKLLARKARQASYATTSDNSLESSFPREQASQENDGPASGNNLARRIAEQSLQLGPISPNPSTVCAAIVKIVAEHGVIARADLLSAMRSSSFPHPAARPQDKSWCQGYIAGAIRNGFLTVAAEPAPPELMRQLAR